LDRSSFSSLSPHTNTPRPPFLTWNPRKRQTTQRPHSSLVPRRGRGAQGRFVALTSAAIFFTRPRVGTVGIAMSRPSATLVFLASSAHSPYAWPPRREPLARCVTRRGRGCSGRGCSGPHPDDALCVVVVARVRARKLVHCDLRSRSLIELVDNGMDGSEVGVRAWSICFRARSISSLSIWPSQRSCLSSSSTA